MLGQKLTPLGSGVSSLVEGVVAEPAIIPPWPMAKDASPDPGVRCFFAIGRWYLHSPGLGACHLLAPHIPGFLACLERLTLTIEQIRSNKFGGVCLWGLVCEKDKRGVGKDKRGVG